MHDLYKWLVISRSHFGPLSTLRTSVDPEFHLPAWYPSGVGGPKTSISPPESAVDIDRVVLWCWSNLILISDPRVCSPVYPLQPRFASAFNVILGSFHDFDM
jgi:hypothetical protein